MTKKEEKKTTLRYPPTPHPSLVIDVIIDLCMSFKKKNSNSSFTLHVINRTKCKRRFKVK